MNPYEITKYEQRQHTREIKEHYADFEGKAVSLGGRLMSKRGTGKASFCDLADRDGTDPAVRAQGRGWRGSVRAV